MNVPTPSEPKKRSTWWKKIESREEALRNCRSAGYFFLILTTIGIVIILITDGEIWIDPVITLVLASILLKFQSRVAAVLLMIQVSAAILFTLLNSESSGGLTMQFVMLLLSIRAIEATFFLGAADKTAGQSGGD
jgi:membrane-associated HD superfamily phosphohydrolase